MVCCPHLTLHSKDEFKTEPLQNGPTAGQTETVGPGENKMGLLSVKNKTRPSIRHQVCFSGLGFKYGAERRVVDGFQVGRFSKI